ncbi:MAG: ABC transporter substrate-binding protein [Ahrensia sp.]|nr:ABC transporter substrate-binding protein [Ahrensia sp.]
MLRWISMALFCLKCVTAYPADPIDISIGYLQREVPPPAVLSNLDPLPEDEGLAGARLGLADNATTGRFLGHNYTLEEQIVAQDGDILAAARTMLAQSKLLLLDMPKDDLLAIADLPEAKDAVLFNVSDADNGLRRDACRANLLHTLPSRAMLADSLAQFAVWKKWPRWALVAGAREGDQAFAAALEQSATKFRLRLVERKDWTFDADMRRNAAREVPLFTQDLPDHDMLIIADEADDYARYIAYQTWQPRPVAGSSGLTPVAWSRVVEQHGAAQLQSRFAKLAERSMRSIDYAAWAAVRSVGEAVTRTATGEVTTLRDYMLGEQFELAGFKGRKLTFRTWNGQLRQPIPLVTQRAVVALAPLEGFLHQFNELDTLGVDRPESSCAAFGSQ